MENVMLCARIRCEPVSDWLILLCLGTMSAFGYIENLASNSTCLINYQEHTRSTIYIFLVEMVQFDKLYLVCITRYCLNYNFIVYA